MKKTKKAIKDQKYENYWKLTVEYSDIHSIRFRNTLKMIVDYIDNCSELSVKYETRFYKKLQDRIFEVFPKADKGSTRKSINQMVKLGFIYPYLSGYHNKTKEFLNATTDNKRELVFSEILYSSANFQSSVTRDNTDIKHINFFLKTLMYKSNRQLNKEEIIALISSDIGAYSKGYMSEIELTSQIKFNKFSQFEIRKYNQIAYFFHFLKYIPGISVTNDKSLVYYTEDASTILTDVIDVRRDPTLFRIMKENIKEESIQVYGKVVCYFTHKELKGLVVSHIIRSEDALRNMDVQTAYDYKNAILLEPNSDAYFDKYDMSFKMDGKPMYGKAVTEDYISDKSQYKIDDVIMKDRKHYMKIHNEKFLQKNNK
ncbi:HNH endonuclease [Staphylococcus haemolyticus]|uniref:HNH endonuclease n=2 Tax=Staphylococcus haemolyticus TaxID=1283 RepID=UPI0015D68165|nr:HNH endonuclease [Staphylococcus haemolyticus]